MKRKQGATHLNLGVGLPSPMQEVSQSLSLTISQAASPGRSESCGSLGQGTMSIAQLCSLRDGG